MYPDCKGGRRKMKKRGLQTSMAEVYSLCQQKVRWKELQLWSFCLMKSIPYVFTFINLGGKRHFSFIFFPFGQCFLKFFIFSWRTVALQCCASFWCTTEWISWRCTPIPSLPPHPSHRSSWVPSCAPWAIQHFALVLYFLHGTVYTSVLISQHVCMSILYVCLGIPALPWLISTNFPDSRYMHQHDIFLFLTDFTL